MNQELRGRLLAHIMFGELEKIAGLKDMIIKSLFKNKGLQEGVFQAGAKNLENKATQNVLQAGKRLESPAVLEGAEALNSMQGSLESAVSKTNTKSVSEVMEGSKDVATKVPTSPLTAPKTEVTIEQLRAQQNSLEAQANVAEEKYFNALRESGISTPDDIARNPKLMELGEEAERLKAEAEAIGERITSMKSTPTSTSPRAPETPSSIKGETSPEVPEVNPGSSVSMGPPKARFTYIGEKGKPVIGAFAHPKTKTNPADLNKIRDNLKAVNKELEAARQQHSALVRKNIDLGIAHGALPDIPGVTNLRNRIKRLTQKEVLLKKQVRVMEESASTAGNVTSGVNPGSSVAMGPASGSTTTRLTEEQTKSQYERLIGDLEKATTPEQINKIRDELNALDPRESYKDLSELRTKAVETLNRAKSRAFKDVPAPPTSRTAPTSTPTSTPTAETSTSIPKPAEGSTSTAVGASKSETALSAEQKTRMEAIDKRLKELEGSNKPGDVKEIVSLNNEKRSLIDGTASTASTGEIPEFSLYNVKTVLTGPMLDSLPTEVATKVRAQAQNGFITSDSFNQLSDDAKKALQDAGVIISNMDDATAASVQAFKADPSKLPVGEMSLDDAKRLLGSNNSGINIMRDGVYSSNSTSKIGVIEGQKVRFFTPAERSQEKFMDTVRSSFYDRHGLSTLEEGATITANNLSKGKTINNAIENDIKTFTMDGKQYAYDRNQARIIGEQNADGSIVGVNKDEASRIQERLDASYTQELKANREYNVGENGLYSAEDLAKMEPGLKKQIPRSEGGLGVKTIEDFKQLETDALNAERIANEMRGTEQGVIFGSKGKLTPELEAQQQQLREEYREAREKLIIEYQKALTAHHKGTTPLSEEAFRKIEGDLKYLKDRAVPYFNSNTLYGNTKGLRSPETPGGILGNKGGTLATGLGLGAVGTIGAMSLLGGGNKQEEQYDPYAGQY